MSTAYHPQTDGQTERVNQELEQYLWAFVDHRQSNWASLLPLAEFSHNNHAHSATKVSPFFALYGYNPEFAVSPPTAFPKIPEAERRLEELREVQKEAQAALEVAADRMKRYYDHSVRGAPEFKPGDLVWLDARNISLERARKLSPRRLGPYKVKRRIGEQNYELELPGSMHIHPVFHVTLLTKHQTDLIPGRVQSPPPPVTVGDQEQYEVEDIRDAKWNGRSQRLRYLIRWKGYTAADDSWEDDEDVFAPEVVRAFYQRHPDADRRPVALVKQVRTYRGKEQYWVVWKGRYAPEEGWIDSDLIPQASALIKAFKTLAAARHIAPLLAAALRGGDVRNLPEIPSIGCLNPETDRLVKGLQPTPHRPQPPCVSAPHDRLQMATTGFTTGSQRTLADVIPCSGSRAMAVTPLEAYSWCRAGRHEAAACPPGFG